jgi:hypothetical protein
VFILKIVKVLCFDTLLQVFILKVLRATRIGPHGARKVFVRANLALKAKKREITPAVEAQISTAHMIIGKSRLVKVIRLERALREGGQVPVFGVRRQAPVRQRGSVSP